MRRLRTHMYDHPKTTIAVLTCVLAWAINSSAAERAGERLLGAALRVGFALFDAEDMLNGIGCQMARSPVRYRSLPEYD